MRNIKAMILGLTLALTTSVTAQQTPQVADGFKADAVYDFTNIDNINLFNGNLTLPIAIGGSYPVSENLSYSLTLTYNGNPWEVLTAGSNGTPVGGGTNGQFTVAIPTRRSNAAVGWSIRIADLIRPGDPRNGGRGSYIFISPDGAEHTLYQDMEHGVSDNNLDYYYSRDNSFIRLREVTPTTIIVEYPNGLEYEFEQPTGNSRYLRVKQIRDQYTGNYLNITYDGTNGINPLWWRLEDSHGRVHTIDFDDAHALPQPTQWVRRPYETKLNKVNLKAYGGATAVYRFTTSMNLIDRPFPHAFDNGNGCNDGVYTCQVTVPMLDKIELPSTGGDYFFTYYELKTDGEIDSPSAAAQLPGSLDTMTLPTLGKVNWDYQRYEIPTNQTIDITSEPPGVMVRQLLDSGDNILHQRLYESEVHGTGTKLYMTTTTTERIDFGSSLEERIEEEVEVNGVVQNVMLSFEEHITKNYFTVYTANASSGNWNRYDYGLPFYPDSSINEDGETAFLSREVYTRTNIQPLKKIRSFYTAYDRDTGPPPHVPGGPNSTPGQMWDINRRERVSATKYVIDGAIESWVARSNYNEFGGWGTEKRFGSGEWTQEKTTNTLFDPQTLPDYANAPSHHPWILALPKSTSTTEDGQSIKTEFCYDLNKGTLSRQRQYRNYSGQRDAWDFVSSFTRDAQGNPTAERKYGGQLTPLPGNHNTDLCNVSLSASNAAFTTNMQYADGVMFRSWISGQNFYSFDIDVDPNTGLKSAEYLFNGSGANGKQLRYDFDYDELGRITSLTPPTGHGYTTTYSYHEAVGSANARVVKKVGNTRYDWSFDHIGRLWKEAEKEFDGGMRKREHLYNDLGYLASTSMWYPDETPTAMGKRNYFLRYDPFGRYTKLRFPDYNPSGPYGSTGRIEYAYKGDRQVITTTPMGIVDLGTSVAQAPTEKKEIYDLFGRLIRVDQDAKVKGVDRDIKATYEYEVGDNLVQAQLHSATNSTRQDRTFFYDGRGVLIKEIHPELGAVRYNLFNALGSPGRKAINDSYATNPEPQVLRYLYDGAGRLSQIINVGFLDGYTSFGDRPVLKEFTYGQSNSGNNRVLGQLQTATRHNYLTLPFGWSSDASVTETYSYFGKGGRVSNRTTDIDPIQTSFSQTWTWDKYGRKRTMIYPRCTTGSCASAVGQPNRVTYHYDRGWLRYIDSYTSATAIERSTVDYLPSGLPSKIARDNGTWEDYSPDPNKMARLNEVGHNLPTITPNPIVFGPYEYDTAGNLIGMQGSSCTVSNAGQGLPMVPNNILFEREKYLYDRSARLINGRHCGNNSDRSYQYDEYGNMTQKTLPTGSTLTLPADPVTNRLVSGSTYTYDAQGNQTRYASDDYLYDRLGQMTSVNQGESKSQYYIYTADEERLLTMDWCLMRDGDTGQCVGVPPANPGWQDHWTFRVRGLNGELLTEYSVEGDINQAFTDPLWDPSRATIGWQWNGDWIYRGNDLFAKRERYGSGFGINHFHKNHLGSVLLVTGPNQEVIDSGNFYTPFGLEAGDPHGPNESTLRFTGHERDFHNGNGYILDYMHARYYSPDRARFLSVDPVLGTPGDPMSWNRYAYVRNNPMTYLDPKGEVAETPWDAFNVFLGTASLANSIRSGNLGAVIVDAAALAYDLTATAVPLMPGGASTLVASKRTVDVATDTLKALDKVKDVTTMSRSSNVVENITDGARASTDFVVTPKGDAIPVPTGASGPTPTRAPGAQYTGGSGGHGLDKKVTGVRVMEGTAHHRPRAVYSNASGQTVNPSTGRTVAKSDPMAHHYLD